MEEELRCPLCKEIYVNPVLLPCYHGLCLACALDTQIQIANANNGSSNGLTSGSTVAQVAVSNQNPSVAHISTLARNNSGESTANSSASESISSDHESDKVSIFSEADSGVICSSRPSSYASTPNLQALYPPSGGAVYSLACPICRKMVFFDDAGARNLPSYRTMQSIIDRFCERDTLRCQMCEIEPKIASVVCEQCQIRYCDACRELCHPARGPLAKHSLIAPRGGCGSTNRESVCIEHCSEVLALYCLTCKIALCQHCLNDNRHQSHEIQSIGIICKAQKVNFEQFFYKSLFILIQLHFW